MPTLLNTAEADLCDHGKCYQHFIMIRFHKSHYSRLNQRFSTFLLFAQPQIENHHQYLIFCEPPRADRIPQVENRRLKP
jgi:hypothetical protein